MGLTVITDDGDRASVKRCPECNAVMDSRCRLADGRELCPQDALTWMRSRRDQKLKAWPMLWRLRDVIRAAEDSSIAAVVRNEELLLVAQLGQGIGARVQHVTVLPDANGVLSYWLWWPDGGTFAGTQLLRPLGDATIDPADAAIDVAAQIVMDRDPTQ